MRTQITNSESLDIPWEPPQLRFSLSSLRTVSNVTFFIFQLNSIDYADVKCIAYACVPCVDHELATSEEVKNLIINIIHNNDGVPRLSYCSLLSLKVQVVYLLNEYVKYHDIHPELPPPRKWQMLLKLGLQEFDPDTSDGRQFLKFFKDKKLQSGLEEALDEVEKREKRCYLPGRNFHVEPLTMFERCFDCVERPPPTIREAQCEEFLEFPLKGSVLVDHLAQEYFAILNALSVRVRDST
jgi:hypothetical protein